MLLLGIDIGTSAIKVSVMDPAKTLPLASTSYPEREETIISTQNGWAEQSPDIWWENVKMAVSICNAQGKYQPTDISAIGITYQMHGLVMVNKAKESLGNSIIWCDSRAVEIGDKAYQAIGPDFCLTHLLNSPGNFTASKLAWIKQNKPSVYEQVATIMLPGDFIAMKLTGEITTSTQALSEGIFWDFKSKQLSNEVMAYYGFDHSIIPEIRPVFSEHGKLQQNVAEMLGLKPGIPITYKAGDQPNNALSLNVTEPGEVAATAGTSGVIYGITDQLLADKESRVNTFAHVNHRPENQRLGVLLCINGTGSMNRWARNTFAPSRSYPEINEIARCVATGSDGLKVLPFGNGAERMLKNKMIGAHLQRLDLNKHRSAHIFRAVQEGIAFSFRYGLDILRENGMEPKVIKAGKANLFLSEIFTQSLVDVTGFPVELYNTDSSLGAAIGAGIGAGVYSSISEAFTYSTNPILIEPKTSLEEQYSDWKYLLAKQLT